MSCCIPRFPDSDDHGYQDDIASSLKAKMQCKRSSVSLPVSGIHVAVIRVDITVACPDYMVYRG
jgi:hypothetical protein